MIGSSGWTAGELVVDGERVIHPGLTEDPLRTSKFYTLYFHSARSMGNGYEWFYFNEVPLMDESVFVSICFQAGKLYTVELSVQGEQFPTSWDNWTVEGERRRYEKHRNMLERALCLKPNHEQERPYPYLEYQMGWGNITSYQDPRSGSTAIAFSFT